MKVVLSWLRSLTDYMIGRVLPAVIILVIGILAARILLRIVKAALEKSKLEKAAHTLISSVLRIVLYVLLGLIVASYIGIDVTGIVALASVLTLAISLSVQNMLTNLIGGFTLLNTKPFTTGHYVEIAGQSGTVKEIGLTYTQLATPDNKIVSIPNGAVVAAEIVNYSVTGTRRVEINVSVSYDSPVEQVLEALYEAAKVETVMDTPAPSAALKSYGESTMNYVLYAWVKTPDYWTTTFAINRNIRTVFNEKNIQMTYPHLNVHLDK